jgi:cysteine desulfurase
MTIYLDYMATTPIHPAVKAEMLKYIDADGIFANPSATHLMGVAAENVIHNARKDFATCINAPHDTIFWTSGATEANNWVIFGIAEQYSRRGKHIIIVDTEHKSIIEPCDRLKKQNFSITQIPTQKCGRIALHELEKAIQNDTILISVMAVNNETGVIQPIKEITAMAHSKGILVHTDAVQALGKIPVDVASWGVDLASFSAHKVYGPKGIGALYKAARVHLPPMFFGGGQQNNLRPGTLATQQIIGMSACAKLMTDNLAINSAHTMKLRDLLWRQLRTLPGIVSNIDFAYTIPHVLNFHCNNINIDTLMFALRDFALSSGSACNAAANRASHVLLAMGIDDAAANRSVRLSLSPFMQPEEITNIASRFAHEIKRFDAIKAI